MDKNDYHINETEDETFAFYLEGLNRLKLKIERKEENIELKQSDLLSKVHTNLADLEMLLREMESANELEPVDTKIEVNKQIEIENPNVKEINFTTNHDNNSAVAKEVNTQYKEDLSIIKSNQENISIKENLQEKDITQYEDFSESEGDMKMDKNIQMECCIKNSDEKFESQFENEPNLMLDNSIHVNIQHNILLEEKSKISHNVNEEVKEIFEENKTNSEIIQTEPNKMREDEQENKFEEIVEENIPELEDEVKVNSIIEINEEKNEECENLLNLNINEAIPKNEIDESKEFKYLELSEIDSSSEVKDSNNHSIIEREKENSDDNKMENIINPFFYKAEKNSLIEEATPLIDNNSVNKTYNEELEQVSVYNLKNQERIIEEIKLDKDDPNQRLLQIIAQIEKDYNINLPTSKDASIVENNIKNEIAVTSHNIKSDKNNMSLVNEIQLPEEQIEIKEASNLDCNPAISELSKEKNIGYIGNYNINGDENNDISEIHEEVKEKILLVSKTEVVQEIKKEMIEENFSNGIDHKQLSDSLNLSITIEKKDTSLNKTSNGPIQITQETPEIISQQKETPKVILQQDSPYKQQINDLMKIDPNAKFEESLDFKGISDYLSKQEILDTEKESPPQKTNPVQNIPEINNGNMINNNFNYSPGRYIKTPFDDDNEIEEISEMKIIEEAKYESSGIVNYLRPSETRENVSNKNFSNQIQSRKFDIIDLIDINQSKFENLLSNKNFDNFERTSNFSKALNDNNHHANSFYNIKSNAYINDPFQLNKSEYSMANSFITKDQPDGINKEPVTEIQKVNIETIPPAMQQNDRNIFPLSQKKASACFIIDNSGINYNEKSEHLDFDEKEIVIIPEPIQTVPEITETDYKNNRITSNENENFVEEEDLNIKLSNIEEKKFSNNLVDNSKVGSLTDLNRKADRDKNYFDDDEIELEINDFEEYEEIRNLTGNNFDKIEVKNKKKNKKNSVKNDKITNHISNNKKKDSLNFSKEKIATYSVSNEFIDNQNKYQNFATEDYDSNYILNKQRKEHDSGAEHEERGVPSRNSLTNLIPLPASKNNNEKFINKPNTEENFNDEFKFKSSKNCMTSVSFKDVIDDNNRNKSRKNTKKNSKKKNLDEIKIITSFNIVERKFHENIADFASIFLEKNYIYKRRRNSILKNCYYQEHILKENNIIDKYKSLPRDFPSILEEGLKKFEQVKDFQSIFDEALKYPHKREELIENLKISEKEDPLIGVLYPITNYLDLYELDTAESKKSFDGLREEISFWRKCECDGDSFYRVFMFGLLENYIVNQNIRGIKMILLDICNVNNYYSENDVNITEKIDLTNVLLIFYLILEYMNKDKYNEAYQVLIKSYYIVGNDFDTVSKINKKFFIEAY